MFAADYPKGEQPNGSGWRIRDFMELEKISTSFFFTDFPKGWTSRSMWSFFNKFALVVDIYVPLKCTKDGLAIWLRVL